jgi:PAS domain S-box-containing protein
MPGLLQRLSATMGRAIGLRAAHSLDDVAPASGEAARPRKNPAAAHLLTLLALVVSIAGLLVFAWVKAPERSSLLMLAGLAMAVVAGLAVLFWYREVARGKGRERDLLSFEARVAGLVESAMDPIITVDDAQRVVVFNAAAERVFRWPRAAVLGQQLDMLIPQRFRDQHRDHIARFATTGVSSRRVGAQSVLRAVRADGEEFPIEASISQHTERGQKLLSVILRDVSERVQAEALIARNEARLRGILESAMDAIITIDDRQHVVLFNAAAEAMFGCRRDEAIGAPLSWFIPERFREAHAAHVQRFGEEGVASRRMGAERIVTGLRRNGEEFPIDASISQLAESGTRFYTVVLRDVTERNRADGEIRRAHQELRELGAAAHMTREQEKSRVARELHDELGGSLTMLQMDVAWCKEKLPPGEGDFAAKLERMEKLLKSTAAATRRIAADLRPLMLDDLGLPDALEWLVQDFSQRTGVVCELSIQQPLPTLTAAQSTAVFRTVQESLSNIAKHARALKANVAIERNEVELTVRVRDNGIGFLLEQARKPNSFGLLGLRERASLLDGKASISSVPGEGTTVELRLPLQVLVSS